MYRLPSFPWIILLLLTCPRTSVYAIELVSRMVSLESDPCTLNYSTIPYKVIPGPGYESYGSIVRKLGHGTSSSVYLLNRTDDKSLVAIKQFTPMSPTLSPQRRTALEECIKLEYHIGRLINGHDGIAETKDLLFEEHTSTWSLVTAFHPHSLAAERRSISPADQYQILYQILSAVQHMHSLGIVYGDSKIENILLTGNGDARLIDFGSATFAGCAVETPGAGVNVVPGDSGTPPYMPPEVFFVLEYDREKADVWSLAILYYVIVVGQIPWQHASADDARFCAFLGLIVPENTCCLPQVNAIQARTCSVAGIRFLQQLPSMTRDVIRQMLELDPDIRPSLDTVLIRWSGIVEQTLSNQ